ncbi:response regulator transcription factor [Micromonospora sp. CA-259024]|uniref:response regulator transcription factor n=1 Tax=Micromonospora sp. CA-259024 TaxID=3239965 RepID=UPI003D93E01D
MLRTDRTRVFLVDSRPISLAGLRTILDDHADLQVVGAAADCEVARARFATARPDVVIVAAHSDAGEAVRSVHLLSRPQPPLVAPKVLVLIRDAATAARQVLDAGGKGLLSSDSDSQEIAAAVRVIATGQSLLVPTARPASRGDSPLGLLTDREVDVFRLMTRGYSNAEICAELDLSQSTVKSHVQKIMEKLGLRNRVHAVIFAYEKNIVYARN